MIVESRAREASESGVIRESEGDGTWQSESGATWTGPDPDRTAYRAMVVLEVAADTGSADDLARVAAALPTAYDDCFTLVESVGTST